MITHWLTCFFVGLAVFVPAWLAVVGLLKAIIYAYDRAGLRVRNAIAIFLLALVAGSVGGFMVIVGCTIRGWLS